MPLRRKVCVLVYRTEPTFEVLLLKRAKTEKGEWHPVTGNVEPHEPIIAAAVREVEEETGFEVTPETLGLTHSYAGGSDRFHETVYAAKAPRATDPTLSEEHTAFAWLSVAEALPRLSWPTQKQALEALAKRKS